MSLEERGNAARAVAGVAGRPRPRRPARPQRVARRRRTDLIAESGSVVVHCPVSNMYLASGVAPVIEMRRRGIAVALASDGPGSNNRQDMFEVMKATALLQKVIISTPRCSNRPRCCTWPAGAGAAAFGLPDAFGAIAVGQRADLVVVDLRSPFVMPVHRVPSALVYNATPRDVRDVIVDGRVLIGDRELIGVDEARACWPGPRPRPGSCSSGPRSPPASAAESPSVGLGSGWRGSPGRVTPTVGGPKDRRRWRRRRCPAEPAGGRARLGAAG